MKTKRSQVRPPDLELYGCAGHRILASQPVALGSILSSPKSCQGMKQIQFLDFTEIY